MSKYTVVGTNAVFGHAPGESFEADLSEFDEARLIAGGHIEKTAKGQKPTKPDSKED